MRIIFAGTPSFAAHALESIARSKHHEVAAVLTQPDRPAGRGMQLVHSPVKQIALQHGISVLQPLTLKDPAIQQELEAIAADVMIVAAYGLILPKPVLDLPRYGCLNIHASLLPRWRGAAPIQRAIQAGDSETGITIMQMDVGLDTGDMLYKSHCPIDEKDTADTLLEKLTALGAEAIQTVLQQLPGGTLSPEKQDSTLATYANKLTKAEATLDWQLDSDQLQRSIRAFVPFPVANGTINQTTIKIWQASVAHERSGEPGRVLEVNKDGILVACGRGALNLEILQRPNGKALTAGQFVQGFSVRPGDQFTRS